MSFSSGDGLSLVLALFPSYPLHGSVWTQTRPHLSITIVPTGVFVYLSLLLFSQSVTIRWFWEPSFYLLSPLQAWPWFDLTVLCENPTKLRLRNYFLSFAVGARPKNFWKDKAKWVFPKKKRAEQRNKQAQTGPDLPWGGQGVAWGVSGGQGIGLQIGLSEISKIVRKSWLTCFSM